ncbi:S1C family serine protease [Pseudomonadota bacterium]
MWFLRVISATLICTLVLGAGAVQAGTLGQESRFAFAEATSRALLDSGEIDFATAIAIGDDIEAMRLGFDAALSPPASGEPRFAIVLDVFLAQASRRVIELKHEPSTVFLGFTGAPGGPKGRPLFRDYDYQLAKIQARRTMSAHVYLIDRVARTWLRTTVDASEDERFVVPYRIASQDPNRENISNAHDREREVDLFEKLELLIELDDLLAEFTAKQDEARPFADGQALRRTVRAAQAQNLKTLEANRFDARPLNDPRFDSVVAVYTGPGKLGSGFYVTPNVVMTNWHVVSEQRFVEMKTYDGAETFGTVLSHDARLDIALVDVERRGRPVAFYTGRDLDLGHTVEAIGHPQGQEYSITRGIVSAIRRHPSINLPRGASGEEVLFVQSDAPTSPGNSGGPLFAGNRVVGMNTWGRIDGQNLNFAVHYAELLNFVNEHLPGFDTDPAQAALKGD